ncbi:MAG: hypothetical protein ACW98D_21370 [Promethearchaeota archaeon]|jgi:hypothetical protein
MNIFLDNTAIHRISNAVKGTDATLPISRMDAVTLLHLAEHILFSDTIEVSAFELQHIQDTTYETIKLLEEQDCISSEDKISIDIVDFLPYKYKNACDNAASKILEDLITINEDTLTRWCSIADESTKPLGIRGSQLEKWIAQEFNESERNKFVEESLNRKANGSFDYIIASKDAIYGQLKALTHNLKTSRDLSNISAFIDVFFRVNINRELANIRSSIYSPAPGRAITIQKSEQLFRYEVEKKIENSIKSIPSNFLNNILQNEILPLPMFAIHFLKSKKVASPLSLLRAARELRENNHELKIIRDWLSKWEKIHSSSDNNKKEKAQKELSKIEHDLLIQKEGFNISALFRGQASIDHDGTPSYSPDVSGLSNEIRKLYLKFYRPAIFLTAIRKEFTHEESLGAEICKILNRPIVN